VRPRVGLVALLVATAACGNSTGPSSGPISFIAGDHQTDTILATLPQNLIARINKVPAPQSVAGQVILFLPLTDNTNQWEAYLEPHGSAAATVGVVAETTNTSGEATVGIRLSIVAEQAHVVVSVPALGYVDTAVFTTQPGHPARLRDVPRDTAVNVGGTVAYRTVIIDQFGNPTTGTVSYQVASGPGTVSGNTVTMTALGTARIAGAAGALHDTTQIYAVPKGVLAAAGPNGMVVFNTDGSGLKTLPSTGNPGTLKWSPSGTAIEFDQAGGLALCLANQSGSLQKTDLNGNITSVVNNASGALQFTDYSRDGMWIYYSLVNGSFGDSARLYRVHPDGSANDGLLNQMPDFDISPTVSPDGKSVAYVADHGGGSNDLRVLTVQTGAVKSLGINAWSPEWSPNSNQIAYLANEQLCAGPISIVNADGTGNRVLTTTPYSASFDWSPDGQWIAALNESSLRIDVINVASGQTMTLPFAILFLSPAWAPSSVSLSK
jgi:Tol biopolymer transport system component